MGDRIEQDGAQLFALARGFGAAEFFEGAGALDGDGDEAADRLQGLAGETRAGNTHAADDAHTDAQRHKGELAGGVEARFAAQGNQLQIMRFEAVDGGAGAIDVGAGGERDGGRADAEGLDDVTRNSVEQFGGVIAREQQLAESVEAFQFLAALDGGASVRAGARRKFAGRDGGDQEGEERDPVLRVGDGERADGRKKKIIESESRDDGHEDRLPHAVKGGNPEDT